MIYAVAELDLAAFYAAYRAKRSAARSSRLEAMYGGACTAG